MSIAIQGFPRNLCKILAVIELSSIPALTLFNEIQNNWANIKKRCRTRQHGAIVAALLNGCSLSHIDYSAASQPILWLAPHAPFHYKMLCNPEYTDILKWAIDIEMAQTVKVGLILK